MDARLKIILRGIRNTIDGLLAAEVGPCVKEGQVSAAIAETPVPSVPEAGEPMIPKATMDKLLDPVQPTVELDSEGLPWDARIHSMGKTRYKTGEKQGQWIIKKKTDPILIARVKSELRLRYPLSDTLPEFPVAAAPPAPPVANTPPAPPVPQEPAAQMSWSELLMKVANSGLEPAVVQAACQKFDIANIGVLQDSPLMIPAVAEELGLE
jgi:hypothetical protein